VHSARNLSPIVVRLLDESKSIEANDEQLNRNSQPIVITLLSEDKSTEVNDEQ
jgi:hypothetical protein